MKLIQNICPVCIINEVPNNQSHRKARQSMSKFWINKTDSLTSLACMKTNLAGSVVHIQSPPVKAGFHMIAGDRRRSRIVDRRSQTIVKRADDRRADCSVSGSVKNYTPVVLARKSQQTTWRMSRRKFCCKQIYFFF